MTPTTIATLDSLREEEWFRNVGVRDTEKAEVLSSWMAAVESAGSPEWEDLCTEAANQYRDRLRENDPGALGRWNATVDLVKPAAEALVREKAGPVAERNKLPQMFIDTVNWDILHLCMECEFADVYPPGFYASQAYWYMAGHFPCGWRGPFPDGGKLVIY
jgi:hypothetical protein